MNSIKKLRKEIDDIDDKILELLNKRAAKVIEIGKLKAGQKKEIYVPKREKEIYDRLSKNNKGPFPSSSLKSVFREIISASRSLQGPLKVAYLGPKGTFTHLAGLEYFGDSTNFIPKNDIKDIFDEVERDKANYGIVPVENSTAGVVTHTLDMFLESELNISAETVLKISLALVSQTGKISEIKKICSHSHAIAQCKGWLTKNLPNCPVVYTSSTASAAKMAYKDPFVGAIVSEVAAKIYNLEIVESKIEDNTHNFTRFLIIGKQIQEKTGDDKTSVVFAIKNEPGALYKTLKPFAVRGVNLTMIESRPHKNKAWEYVFFVDMDGHLSDANISDSIGELKDMCSFLKILGSYPKARVS
ncbi:MAG: prephenate dehydratase [bacterium]